MSRRFLPEAEALSKRVPDLLYYAGEPALWALILIEAGDCPLEQAHELRARLFSSADSPLRDFANALHDAYLAQEDALRNTSDFQACQKRARQHIKSACELADTIENESSKFDQHRKEQAQELARMYVGRRGLGVPM